MSSAFTEVIPKGNISNELGKPFITGLISRVTGTDSSLVANHKSTDVIKTPDGYLLDSIKEKRKKEVAARSTVNKNKEAYGAFIETKNIKLTLPTESLANDDAYNMFKQNVMRSKYKNKDEIMKYADAVRKAEQDEANLK